MHSKFISANCAGLAESNVRRIYLTVEKCENAADDARLIVAAPDLLDHLIVVAEQLEVLGEAIEQGIKPNASHIKAKARELRAAINKAEGREEK